MFDAGRMPVDAHREQPRKNRRAYSTVWRVYEQWKHERAARPAEATPPVATPTDGQLALWTIETEAAPSGVAVRTPPAPDEGDAEIVPMTAAPVRGGKLVQHIGSWILLALAGELVIDSRKAAVDLSGPIGRG